MKKLLYIILLLPLWVQAQNVTMNKTNGYLRTLVSGTATDSVMMSFGTGVNGYIPIYNSTLKKNVYTNPSTIVPTISFGTFGSTPNAQGGSYSAGTITLQPASGTHPGGVSTTTQTWAGDKTLTGSLTAPVIINSTISSTATNAITGSFANNSTGFATIKATNSGSGNLAEFANSGGVVATIANSGNITAPTFIGSLTGHASLDLPLTGGTLSGALNGTSVNLSDVVKFSASSATLAAGDMGYNSTYGQYLRGKTGSTDDWALFAAGGGYVMHNPTGTNKVAFGSLSGSGDVITGADNTGSVFKIGIGSGLSLDPSTKVLSATGGSSGSVTTSGLTAGRIVIASGASDISTTTTLTISGSDLNVTGALNSGSLMTEKSIVSDYVAKIRNSNTGAGTSFGLLVNGGTNTSDKALTINNAANTTTLLTVDGVGNTAITGNITASNLGSASGYTATSANTVLTVPLRDSNGDFAARIITASLAGNASTVTTNANLTGVVTSSGNATSIADAALSIAKTSGLQSALDLKAPLASPALTGSPTAPTQTAGDNSTKIATTAYVDGSISSVASSNTYTPTPSAGSNSVTITPRVHMYTIVGKIVTVYGAAVIDYTSDNTTTIFSITLPAGVGGGGFPNIYSATGSGVSMHTSNVERTVLIDAISSTSSVTISSTSPVTLGKQYEVKYSFMYKIN